MPNQDEQAKIQINFVPPSGPTQAELRLLQMTEAFMQLPENEREEIRYVRERINFLRSKYGSSADLAIAFVAIEIGKERGQ